MLLADEELKRIGYPQVSKEKQIDLFTDKLLNISPWNIIVLKHDITTVLLSDTYELAYQDAGDNEKLKEEIKNFAEKEADPTIRFVFKYYYENDGDCVVVIRVVQTNGDICFVTLDWFAFDKDTIKRRDEALNKLFIDSILGQHGDGELHEQTFPSVRWLRPIYISTRKKGFQPIEKAFYMYFAMLLAPRRAVEVVVDELIEMNRSMPDFTDNIEKLVNEVHEMGVDIDSLNCYTVPKFIKNVLDSSEEAVTAKEGAGTSTKEVTQVAVAEPLKQVK